MPGAGSDLLRVGEEDPPFATAAGDVDRVLDAGRHRAIALVARVPADRWSEVGTIPWYGLEYSLDDLVVYLMYGHKREHAPQLEAVLERSVALS